MRFDDQCKNGHNDFAITAEVREPGRRDVSACGCLHDDIAAVFPELAPLIRWHLVGTDGPMHYIANTLYFASDADAYGRRAGEPSAFTLGSRFGNSPITVALDRPFFEWLQKAEEFNASALKTNPAFVHFEPVPVAHTRQSGTYEFADKFTFKGYAVEWHRCPFDSIREAEEFSAALRLSHEFVRVPTEWSKGKARELTSARNAAAWPEATDEQLSVPREELRAVLEARLPALLVEFRAAMEGAGFLWSAAGVADQSTKG
jgi:hypothetical protein